MPIEEARRALEDYETELRQQLPVPDGGDWYAYIPENSRGDRMFAEWQRLGRAVRRAEETAR